MTYPNYFQNYQPNYQQNYQPINQNTQNTSQDERVWVSNEQAAESFLLAPSSFVRLWDSSTNKFYEKRSDINGRPLPMDIYEYKRVMPLKPSEIEDTTKLSFDEINEKIEAINERLNTLEKAKKGVVKNGTKSSDDDTSI